MTKQQLIHLLSLPKVWHFNKVLRETGFPISSKEFYEYTVMRKAFGTSLSDWPAYFVDSLEEDRTDSLSDLPDSGLFEWSDGELRDFPEIKVKPTFSQLTKEDEQRIAEIHNSKTISVREKANWMYLHYGVEWRTAQRWFTELGLTNRSGQTEVLLKAQQRKTGDAKYHFYTWAQNATPLHARMWESMKTYAAYLGAEIHVIPGRYTNPTSTFPELPNEYWAPEVIPFLDLTRHDISMNLRIAGDLKIQPTAAYPLEGLHTISQGKTMVVGHPKMHLTPSAVLEGCHKQITWSTGAVTVQNYTDSKAGKAGESHHALGFVIVELDGDKFHVRHVPVCDDGSFIDLCNSVTKDGVSDVDTCKAVTLGDLHWGDHDENKLAVSVALCQTIKPEYLILEDVFNGHSVNHHDRKDPVKSFHKLQSGRSNIADEVRDLATGLFDLTQSLKDTQLVVVRSNHDEWLDRYIKDMSWKDDLLNAGWYAKFLSVLLSDPDCKGLIPHFLDNAFKDETTKDGRPALVTLTRDQSFRPGTYEYGNHGDLGANGTRGNIKQYARTSTNNVVGDYHAPNRINGSLSVGTSTHLRVGYNKGLSSWGWADVIEYNNGKATHIIQNEDYRFTSFFD